MQLTSKVDIDEVQAFEGSPSVTGNKTVRGAYLEPSGTSMSNWVLNVSLN